MKHIKFAALIATAITSACILIFIAGCGGGGSKTQTITSPYHGSIFGMVTEPSDSETNIGTDTWIHIFWDDPDFAPPSEFTVRIEREDTAGNWYVVRTELVTDSSNPAFGDWWFRPVNDLRSNTWHRIIVTDNFGNKDIIMFLTSDYAKKFSSGINSDAAAPGTYKPKNADSIPPSTGPIADEHRIQRETTK